MATVDDYLAKARSYIGTTETPPNSNINPFSLRLGRPAEPWCADALIAIADEVGLQLPSRSAYTPTMADGFKRAGRWTHSPAPGHFAFFDFPNDNTYGIQHIEVVERVENPSTILDLGGNTSSGITGSQDNGGGFFERVRPTSWVVGYGIPPYDQAPIPVGPGALATTDEENEMGAVVDRPQGGWIVIGHDGAVFAYEGAPYLGGVNQHPEWKQGGNVVGGAWTPSGNGYWIVGRDGAVFTFGDATYRGGFNAESPQTRGGRYAIGLATKGNGYAVITFDPSNDGSPYDEYAYGV